MFRGKGADVVAVPLHRPADRVTGFHFVDLDWKRHALHAELQRRWQHFLCALRAVQKQRFGPPLQAERPDQADDAEEMVGVKVRKEDFGQREADPIAHHLTLGPFAALEQERFAFAMNG